MPNINILTKGQIKALDFSPWGGIDGFLAATSNEVNGNEVIKLRKVVPWLNKAIRMTANAVSQLPYCIYNGETEVELGAAWGIVRNPQTLISLLAASLCGGRAYMRYKVGSKGIITAQYLAPQTMTPNYNTNGELLNFTRQYQGKREQLSIDEVVYFWLPDDTVETGPAEITPIGNALLSAGLLAEMDNTLFQYGKRGFIPPTILAVKGMMGQSTTESTERWWNAFLRGWTNTIAKVINAEYVTPQIMGAGMEDLKGTYIEITEQMIKNIAAAFGIPNSTFMSDENSYATATSDMKLWYSSSEFVSIYQTIEDSLTNQLWARFKWDMKYEPEQIEAFQQEETDKSGALSTLANSIDTQPEATLIAAEILGYDLTDEQIAAIEAMEKEPEPEPITTTTEMVPVYPEPTDEENEMADEIMKWRKFMERPHKREFETKHIPPALAMRINAGLRAAKSQDEIQAVFDNLTIQEQQPDNNLKSLADAINAASLAVTTKTEPPVYNMTMPAITMSPITLTTQMPAQGTVVVNIPEQPAPTVNVSAPNVTVTNEPAVNNVTVQPAEVMLPPVPREATITTDAKGNKTLKVK